MCKLLAKLHEVLLGVLPQQQVRVSSCMMEVLQLLRLLFYAADLFALALAGCFFVHASDSVIS